MTSMDKHVAKYMVATGDASAEAVSASTDISTIVNSGDTQANLLQLIQSLGEYLTNDDGFIRAKATGLLSHVLSDTNQSSINAAAVDVLVHFYCDRLADETCVPKLLEGIDALVTFDNFKEKGAMTVSKMLFENVKAQSFPQTARYRVYSIIGALVARYSSALRSMNNEFVFGFTQAMDGEKDPRNLMKAFALVKEIVVNFDISNHVEDLFEVTFCYFPITFKPPPDDPYGITAEDLKITLRHSLSSSPLFSKFAMPLLLEKLSSSSGSAKKDSMETIAECAPVYGASALLPDINELFDALKVEVFHATDPALEDTALEAIHQVVAALSTTVSSDSANDPAENALKPLVVECMVNLKDPELKNAKPAGRILRAAASASDPAFNSIIDAIMPILLRHHRETNLATQKKAVLDILLEFLEASKTLYGEISDLKNDADFQTPLLGYKDRLWELFESATMASNEYNGLRLAGIQGLHIMTLMKNFLADNEIGLAVRTFTKILVDQNDNELRVKALSSLLSIAKTQQQQILDYTVPVLMDTLPASEADDRAPAHQKNLEYLIELSSIPAIFDVVGVQLLSKFETATRQQPDQYLYPYEIIHAFDTILNQKTEKQDIGKWVALVFEKLFGQCISTSLTQTTSSILNDHILSIIGSIAAVIFQHLEASVQSQYINRLFDIYTKSDLSSLKLESDHTFKPLDASSPDTQKKTSTLFAVAVSSYSRTVQLPIASHEEFLGELVSAALASSCELQVIALAQLHGAIVNKWTDDAVRNTYVESLVSKLVPIAESNHAALTMLLWTCKALVLMAKPIGYTITDQLITWCASPVLGGRTAHGFELIVGDDNLVLNRASGATVNLLYKQRFFNYCLPKLVENFKSSQADIKPNYLIALSYLLRNVRKQVLLNELPPLIPLLLDSLELDDASLKISTLDTFRIAVMDAPEIISQHVRRLVPALLQVAQHSKQMAVRISALTCLAQFPVSLTRDVLQPHSTYAIKQLSLCLDDNKRLVRRQAVDCRSKWYGI
ncbi:Dos2-interacting transcription regulator of RNA-Pol-II-domain-containing protein [Umbelopsis sp. AD052]|nr:Dos2-interacting transcription regulator of RNA-Pol-II-domain-containing protein [Umbelopsis sp. AD052]